MRWFWFIYKDTILGELETKETVTIYYKHSDGRALQKV